MLLEADMVQKRVLDMSRPVEREDDDARRCPGRHQLRQGYLEFFTGKGNAKEAHKRLLTEGADDTLGLFVRLGLALGILRRVLRLAFAFLLSPGALYAVSIGKRVECW